jgi:hypothetical protein
MLFGLLQGCSGLLHCKDQGLLGNSPQQQHAIDLIVFLFEQNALLDPTRRLASRRLDLKKPPHVTPILVSSDPTVLGLVGLPLGGQFADAKPLTQVRRLPRPVAAVFGSVTSLKPLFIDCVKSKGNFQTAVVGVPFDFRYRLVNGVHDEGD